MANAGDLETHENATTQTSTPVPAPTLAPSPEPELELDSSPKTPRIIEQTHQIAADEGDTTLQPNVSHTLTDGVSFAEETSSFARLPLAHVTLRQPLGATHSRVNSEQEMAVLSSLGKRSRGSRLCRLGGDSTDELGNDLSDEQDDLARLRRLANATSKKRRLAGELVPKTPAPAPAPAPPPAPVPDRARSEPSFSLPQEKDAISNGPHCRSEPSPDYRAPLPMETPSSEVEARRRFGSETCGDEISPFKGASMNFGSSPSEMFVTRHGQQKNRFLSHCSPMQSHDSDGATYDAEAETDHVLIAQVQKPAPAVTFDQPHVLSTPPDLPKFVDSRVSSDLTAASGRCWLWVDDADETTRIANPAGWFKDGVVNDIVSFAAAHHSHGHSLPSGIFPLPLSHEAVGSCTPSPTLSNYKSLRNLAVPPNTLTYAQRLGEDEATWHWVFVELDMDTRTYVLLDSLPSQLHVDEVDENVQRLVRFLESERDTANPAGSQFSRNMSQPFGLSQSNGNDCGVFACMASASRAAAHARTDEPQQTTPNQSTHHAAQAWRAFLSAVASQSPLIQHMPPSATVMPAMPTFATSLGHSDGDLFKIEDLRIADLGILKTSAVEIRNTAKQITLWLNDLGAIKGMLLILHAQAKVRMCQLANEIDEIYKMELDLTAMVAPLSKWVNTAGNKEVQKMLGDLRLQRRKRILDLAYLSTGWQRIASTDLQGTVAQLEDTKLSCEGTLQRFARARRSALAIVSQYAED